MAMCRQCFGSGLIGQFGGTLCPSCLGSAECPPPDEYIECNRASQAAEAARRKPVSPTLRIGDRVTVRTVPNVTGEVYDYTPFTQILVCVRFTHGGKPYVRWFGRSDVRTAGT
jgi:hypothetical protein